MWLLPFYNRLRPTHIKARGFCRYIPRTIFPYPGKQGAWSHFKNTIKPGTTTHWGLMFSNPCFKNCLVISVKMFMRYFQAQVKPFLIAWFGYFCGLACWGVCVISVIWSHLWVGHGKLLALGVMLLVFPINLYCIFNNISFSSNFSSWNHGFGLVQL